MSRYVVTELLGFLADTTYASQPPGLSCTVIDTFWNHAVCATYRSEDIRGRGRKDSRAWARKRAAEDCAARNAAHEREAASSSAGTAA